MENDDGGYLHTKNNNSTTTKKSTNSKISDLRNKLLANETFTGGIRAAANSDYIDVASDSYSLFLSPHSKWLSLARMCSLGSSLAQRS